MKRNGFGYVSTATKDEDLNPLLYLELSLSAKYIDYISLNLRDEQMVTVSSL